MYTREMASFYDNRTKPVPECQTILSFTAAGDNRGRGDTTRTLKHVQVICT